MHNHDLKGIYIKLYVENLKDLYRKPMIVMSIVYTYLVLALLIWGIVYLIM